MRSGLLRRDSESGPMTVIPGVDIVEPDTVRHPLAHLAETPEGWRRIFNEALRSVRLFLSVHDPIGTLAKCVDVVAASAEPKKANPRWIIDNPPAHHLIEQAELEFMQAVSLMQSSPPKSVPASPMSMHKFFPHLPKITASFARMQVSTYPNDPERERVITQSRLYTIHHRNLFDRNECEYVVGAILNKMDRLAERELGAALSDVFQALIKIRDRIEEKLTLLLGHAHGARHAEDISAARGHIEFFCSISKTATRAWSLCAKRCVTLADYRFAAFQLSELCYGWGCTFDRDALEQEFGSAIFEIILRMALQSGDLATANPEHFLMNNPVWSRPFILRGTNEVSLPLPHLIYSFPFQIFEQLIAHSAALERAYFDARSEVLEESIRAHISTAMPSARTYHKVLWRDDDGTLFENDVVAIVGNTIFLFEAKSGRLHDAARRGAELKLTRNFKDLFVEPARQAARLEQYLNEKGHNARLWIKDTCEPVRLDLDKPKC